MNERHFESQLARDGAVANLIRLGSLVAIAVGLFALVIGVLAVYLNLSAQLELERADRVASQQADRIADELADIQTALRDASVVDAARSGGSEQALREALRERGVVNILDVQLLPADRDAIAVGDNGLGFAATEQVLEAAQGEQAAIRVLRAGTPAESLTFAQRLPGDIGVLLLRTTVSVVASLLRAPEQLDFVALAQAGAADATVLESRGRAGAGALRESPIAGSRLMLQWRKQTARVPLGNQAAVILACSGLIVMLTGLLLRRRTRLARYLEGGGAKDSGERVVGPHQPDRPSSRGAGESRPTAQKTMVLERETAQAEAGDDEPDTEVASVPELPDWLLDDEEDEAPSDRR